MRSRRTARWAALAGAAAAVAAQVLVQVAGATPASAVTGLVKTSSLSATDSQPSKTATAYCPVGKRVTGGGGWVFALAAADSAKVTLTQLRPVHPASGQDSYVVTGWETTTTMTGNWWLEAYAICADAGALSGYQIVAASSTSSSLSRQAAAAVCPTGKRALGSGARIGNPGGEVGLQVARASGTGDITRGEAHEDANGYAGTWWVSAYAICVYPPAGYEVVYGSSAQQLSESEKIAFAVCPTGKRVHGAGAAISNLAPGGVSLQVIYPFNALNQVEAFAVENTPTSQNWDFIVAQAICAT